MTAPLNDGEFRTQTKIKYENVKDLQSFPVLICEFHFFVV